MIAGLPALSHEQQQKAVERIQELMAQGMSCLLYTSPSPRD